jgi:hypothetical protein
MSKGFAYLCKYCDKEFRVKQRGAKYCSRSCANRAYPERNLGKKHSEEAINKIKKARNRQTQIMGSPMKGKKHTPEARERMSLASIGKNRNSPEHIETLRQKFLGSNNPRWKGGITSASRAERIKFRLTMQKLVFERDGYTCVECKVSGNALQVDHIKSWAKHPELRFTMDNCQTLCMKCHYKKTFNKVLPDGLVWGHNLNKSGRVG